MKKSIGLLLTASLMLSGIFVGCEKEKPAQQEEPSQGTETLTSTTIPVENALASLSKLSKELYGETKTAKKNYSVEVFGGVKTKSSRNTLPDTTLYIVNMEDGYAVLSAQSKIKTEVFCITESGSISAADIQKAILRMEYTPSPQKSSDNENDGGDDSEEDEDDYFEDLGRETVPAIIAASVLNQWYYGCEPEYEVNATKANTYTGTPNTSAMLKTKWDQGAPFNNFRKDGAPAGCVAVATAQIIEFNALNHGYTSFTDGKKFDWNLLFTVCHCSNPSTFGLSSAQQQEASNFLSYVGLKKNCYIRYDATKGSYGYADGAKRTFKNMKYKSVKKYLGFEKADKNRAIAQLTNGFPMYMGGVRGTSSGHAWVLDGIYVRKVYNETGSYLRTESFFHINWGWQGWSDGYYTQGVFDTSKRQAVEAGVDFGYSAGSYNYTWDYRTITYSL